MKLTSEKKKRYPTLEMHKVNILILGKIVHSTKKARLFRAKLVTQCGGIDLNIWLPKKGTKVTKRGIEIPLWLYFNRLETLSLRYKDHLGLDCTETG